MTCDKCGSSKIRKDTYVHAAPDSYKDVTFMCLDCGKVWKG